jgi:hypothetical protein
VTATEILEIEGDSLEELKRLAAEANLTVVLSNHYVRYAVLPWSEALDSDESWLAYAAHVFTETHGNAAAGWEIRVSDSGRRRPRVACAIDRALLERLRAIPGVVSVQPYLMAAFNARHAELAGGSTWFVLHEPGRLTLGLIVDGLWRLVRNRHARADWRASLPHMLARELGTCGELPVDRVIVHSEEEQPFSMALGTA